MNFVQKRITFCFSCEYKWTNCNKNIRCIISWNTGVSFSRKFSYMTIWLYFLFIYIFSCLFILNAFMYDFNPNVIGEITHYSQTPFKFFGFPVFRFWVYTMKIIPATRRRRRHYIWYLLFITNFMSVCLFVCLMEFNATFNNIF